ncbi:MAG: DNA helicase [SAR202 cluster bacterium]|nr:DNA helicase [SAR202 cluster bacterium]
MRFQTARPFDRNFGEAPPDIQGRVEKQLALLLANPRHPSLGLKRIRGANDVWELRVSRSYRITLQIAGDTYILRRLVPHDVLRQP